MIFKTSLLRSRWSSLWERHPTDRFGTDFGLTMASHGLLKEAAKDGSDFSHMSSPVLLSSIAVAFVSAIKTYPKSHLVVLSNGFFFLFLLFSFLFSFEALSKVFTMELAKRLTWWIILNDVILKKSVKLKLDYRFLWFFNWEEIKLSLHFMKLHMFPCGVG